MIRNAPCQPGCWTRAFVVDFATRIFLRSVSMLCVLWRRFLITTPLWWVARVMHATKFSKRRAPNLSSQTHLPLMQAQPLPPKVRQECLELLVEMLKSVIALERKEASRE